MLGQGRGLLSYGVFPCKNGSDVLDRSKISRSRLAMKFYFLFLALSLNFIDYSFSFFSFLKFSSVSFFAVSLLERNHFNHHPVMLRFAPIKRVL